jgi:acetyltransferase EpsM
VSRLGVIVGAGAQGRVTLEVWRAAMPDARFVFVDDDERLIGSSILGAEVIGPLATVAEHGGDAVLALGNNRTRLALAARLDRLGLRWATIVHPSAVVMPSARLGPGTVVFPNAVVGSEAQLGAHVVVNSGVVLEHDSVVESGANLSPGVRTGGRIHVGEGAFISTGVTLAPRVKVGAWSVIGAGSVVVRDIGERTLAFGVPARPVRTIDESFDWKSLL